jgi:hypothetical protein
VPIGRAEDVASAAALIDHHAIAGAGEVDQGWRCRIWGSRSTPRGQGCW